MRLGLLAALFIAVGTIVLIPGPEERAARARPTPPSTSSFGSPIAPPPRPVAVDIGVAPRARPVNVPHSFLGISTEYWALPIWERQPDVLNRVLSLLHSPGDAPLIVRIGGDSADETLWKPKMRKVPEWAFELTSSWLDGAAALVNGAAVRLILDLNLVTATPAVAAEWARAAEAALPPGSIAGLEIGNEPDLYNRKYWISVVEGQSVGTALLPRQLLAGDYAHDFRAYARELSQARQRTPLLGPAVAGAYLGVKWIMRLLASPHPGLRTISTHRYPYSACALPGTPGWPTIPRVLSPTATSGVAQALAPAIRVAHHAGLLFRLTEMNSVTCGGRRGVSDTFATALWAPDALFELIRGGVDAVNVHIRPRTINPAFTLGAQGLDARPLLYGLMMYTRTLGPGARLVPLQVGARHAPALKAWAVRVRGDALHVLLIDKGNQPVTTSLHFPTRGPATIQRLIAPSVRSKQGVTLAGQWLGVDGTWQGPRTTETVRLVAGGYRVTVPAHSEALVIAHLRGGVR